MKTLSPFSLIILLLINGLPLNAQKFKSHYDETRHGLMQGWNTWSTYSMCQYVLLPSGATINLGLLKRGVNNEAAVNRFFVDKNADGWNKPIVRPGYHSYSGDYTEISIHYRNVDVKIETASENENLYILVTPVKTDSSFSTLVTFEAGIAWGKPGKVYRNGHTLNIDSENTNLTFHASQKPVNKPFNDENPEYPF